MEQGTPSERINDAMRRAGIDSAAEVARRAGVKDVTMRSYVNGGRNPPLDVAIKIGRALNVSGQWIFEGKGRPTDANPASAVEPNATAPRALVADFSTDTLPVYGSAMGGRDGRFELNGQEIDRIAAPPGLRGAHNAYAVYVVGSSMEPRYHEGETVYIHPGRPVRQGDYVVVQINPERDGDVPAGLVKRFISRSTTRVLLEQYNPPERLELDASAIGAIHRIVLSGE